MMNCVLITIHPMLGCDMHDTIPPPGPVVVPAVPHFAAATLRWLMPTHKKADTISTMGFSPMQQGTDIGNFIPHISAPHYLLPLVIALSGSKSHFGVASVHMQGQPVAVALLVVLNLNLNCSGATCPPLPTGVVIAPNTVVSSMTLGDFLGGLFAMVVDAAIQFGLNRLFGSAPVARFFGRIQGPIIQRLLPGAPRFTSMLTALLAQNSRVLSNPYVAQTLAELVPSAVGVMLGSPLGYAPPWAPIGNAAGWASDTARAGGEALGDAITGGPNTEQFPSSPPAGSTPTPMPGPTSAPPSVTPGSPAPAPTPSPAPQAPPTPPPSSTSDAPSPGPTPDASSGPTPDSSSTTNPGGHPSPAPTPTGTPGPAPSSDSSAVPSPTPGPAPTPPGGDE